MDMNGLQAVDEVTALILEFLKAWKNYKRSNARWSTAGVTRGSRNARGTYNVYSQLSGLEDVVFNDFIKDDFIPEGDGEVASGSTSLPNPVVSTSVTPECLWRMCLRLLT